MADRFGRAPGRKINTVKIILFTMLCLLLALSVAAQRSAADGQRPQTSVVGVEEVYLAKDNGEGVAGEATESFLTTDIPIYCVVQLDSTRPATVKMNLVAVSVAGVKAESRVITVSYQTNGQQSRVYFTGKPDRLWIAGSYRIEVFVDDKLAAGKNFEIVKSPSVTPKTAPVVEDFLPAKPKPKPKLVKTSRKN